MNDPSAGFGGVQNGAVHINGAEDESYIGYIYSANPTGDVWHVDSVCCGTSFDHVQGISTFSGGGVPLTLGTSYILRNATWSTSSTTVTASYGSLTLAQVGSAVYVETGSGTGIYDDLITAVTPPTSFTLASAPTASGSGILRIYGTDSNFLSVSINDSTFNVLGTGLSNQVIGQNAQGVIEKNVYMEIGSTVDPSNSPLVFIDQGSNDNFFYGLMAEDNGFDHALLGGKSFCRSVGCLWRAHLRGGK